MEYEVPDRHKVVDQIFDALRAGTSAALVGPQGTGRAQTLSDVAVKLAGAGIPHLLVSAGDPDFVERVRSFDAAGRFLVYDLEKASREQLLALVDLVGRGGVGVVTLTDTIDTLGYSERVHDLYDEHPWLATALEGWASFQLELYDDEQIERLAHRSSRRPLSSDVIAAITRFARGRPSWVFDLVQLAEGGTLRTSPRPHLSRLRYTDAHLPNLRLPESLAHEHLGPADVANAVILSELGPRLLSGIANLIGAPEQGRLLDSGMLIPASKDSELHCVPELYAAAIHHLTGAEQLHPRRVHVAEQLLAQEQFGIPLDDHESEFCVLALNSANRLSEVPGPLLSRVIEALVSFGGSEEARDLILRAGDLAKQIDPLLRARLAAELRDPFSGLSVLRPALSAEPGAEPRAAALALHCQLVAESGFGAELAPQDEPAEPSAHDAKLVFDRWNDDLPLGADVPELVRISHTHPSPEVSLAAELLVRFECSRQGVRCLEFPQNNAGERLGQAVVRAADENVDLLGTLILAYCTIRALSGHYAAPLFPPTLLARLPGHDRHLLWMNHLSAAIGAMSCGDAARTGLEWELFLARIPRFIPARLRLAFGNLNEVLRDPDGPPSSADAYARQVGAYLQRNFAAVHKATFNTMPDQELVGPHVTPLPMRELIRQHLTAFEAQHPMALMQVSVRLADHQLWAPAAYALQEARAIYLSRRATGGVGRCDQALQDLRRKAEAALPWFDFAALPAPSKTRLTPRELSAARLAAQGKSNRAIAEQLRCSVRTVESHLAQARAKLGATHRAQLGPLLESRELSAR